MLLEIFHEILGGVLGACLGAALEGRKAKCKDGVEGWERLSIKQLQQSLRRGGVFCFQSVQQGFVWRGAVARDSSFSPLFAGVVKETSASLYFYNDGTNMVKV